MVSTNLFLEGLEVNPETVSLQSVELINYPKTGQKFTSDFPRLPERPSTVA